MIRTKRFIALLMSVIVIICSFDYTGITTQAAEFPVVYSNNVKAVPGREISIPVHIADNNGIMGFGIEIKYDSSYLKPLNIKAGNILANGMLNDSIATSEAGDFEVLWSGNEDISEDGILFYISFYLNDNVEGKTDINITYEEQDTFDEDWNPVKLECNDFEIECVSDINEGTGNEVPEARAYTDNISIIENGMLKVPVFIDSSSGLMGFKIIVKYDKTIIEPERVEKNNEITGSIVDNIGQESNEFSIVCTGTENICSEEHIFIMYFNINDIENSSTNITFDYVKEDTFDETYQEINLAFDDVKIDVANLKRIADSTPAPSLAPIITSTPIPSQSPSPTKKPAQEVYSVDLYGNNLKINDQGLLEVPVYIRENKGLMGFKLNVTYDAAVINPTKVLAEGVLTGSFMTNIGTHNGNFDVLWSGTDNMNTQGKLFTMYFEIIDSTNTSSDIAVNYVKEDTFNEDYDDVRIISDVINTNLLKLSGNEPEPTSKVTAVPPQTPTKEPPQTPTKSPTQFPTNPPVVSKYYVNLHGNNVLINEDGLLEVPIFMQDNQGIMGFKLNVSYDSKVLKPRNVSPKVNLGGSLITNIGVKDGSYTILWSGTENFKEQGQVFTMIFEILDKTATTDIDMDYVQEDTFNEDYDDVGMSINRLVIDLPKLTIGVTPVPSSKPTETPTSRPTSVPTNKPTSVPTKKPTSVPTNTPTTRPTQIPTKEPSSDAYKVRLYSDNIIMNSNGKLEIPVYIADNKGLMGFKINVGYDNKVLELEKVVSERLLSGSFISNNDKNDNMVVMWTGTEDMNEQGKIFTLICAIKNPQSNSTSIRLNYEKEDTFNEEYVDVGMVFDDINIDLGKILNKDNPTQTPTQTPTQSPTHTPTNTPTTSAPTETPETPSQKPTESPKPTDIPITPSPEATMATQPSPQPTQVPKDVVPTVVPPIATAVVVQITQEPSIAKKSKVDDKVSITSISNAKSKSVIIKWKGSGNQESYELQYAMNKKFTVKKKWVRLGKNVSKKTIKKLKIRKTYYFRIRMRYKVDGKNVVGVWSKIRKIKIKK